MRPRSSAFRRVAALMTAGLVVVGCASRSPAQSTRPGTLPHATAASTSSTPTASLAAASASLASYLAAENARETAAGANSPQAVWGTNVYEHSTPVAEPDGYIAVAAFAFDPGGHPVEVLSYRDGEWSQVAALPPPTEAFTVVHADAIYLISNDTPVVVGYATDGQPDFLIPFAGAGCGRGPVISKVSGAWRYISFTGVGATSEVLGGNPQFLNSGLASDNDCAASVPVAERRSWSWAYDPKSGNFVATEHPGWPARPTEGAARSVLPPAPVAPVRDESSLAVTNEADGNVTPLLCPAGGVNAVAWRHYATGYVNHGPTQPSHTMALGPEPTAAEVTAAMCFDYAHLYGTAPLTIAAGRLAFAYYGWSFPDNAISAFDPSTCPHG